ncbi:MAG: hypothetical protein AAB340_02670 [Patescibacteria group bacterium]
MPVKPDIVNCKNTPKNVCNSIILKITNPCLTKNAAIAITTLAIKILINDFEISSFFKVSHMPHYL